jgi:diphosphomevalonate decarboxylase
MALWGQHPDISASSNEFAIPFSENIHPVFNTFHDDILIISHKEKSVSSTAGHHLMEGNPFAGARYQQANNRIKQITQILKQGEIDAFGLMAEAEALTLHALMMCSEPSYMLMEPASLIVIEKIQQFRKEAKLPVYFTLDAGPNIHILYPGSEENTINTWISQELTPHCAGGKIIRDKVGKGPIKI